MAILFPPIVEPRVREQVDRGHFPDADEVIREAMRLLLDEQERRLDQLRAKLRVGLDQLERGAGVPFTRKLVAQMRRDADERLRRGDQLTPDVCP